MDEKEKKIAENAMEEMIGMEISRDNCYNAQYGWVREDGEFTYADYTYCHGMLQNLLAEDDEAEEYWDEDEEEYKWSGGSDKPVVAIINQIQKPMASEKNALRYYEWLFNFSPFRSIFPMKDTAEVWERHIFYTDTDVPANLMAGGLMASRFPTENHGNNGVYRLCDLWGELIDREVHPNLAFSVANTFSISPNEEIRVALGGTGHSSIEPMTYLGSHKNFLNDKPVQLLPTYRSTLEYHNVSALWGEGWSDEEEELNTSLISLTNELAEVSNKNVNPFKAASVEWGDGYRGSASKITPLKSILDPLALLLNRETKGLLA